MLKNPYVIGAIFGFLAPFVGLFIGLQISPVLGTLLLAPVISLGDILETPVGDMSDSIKILALWVSIAFWSLFLGTIFSIIGTLKRRFSKRQTLDE